VRKLLADAPEPIPAAYRTTVHLSRRR
jgi:hypothetical protein